MVKRSTQLFYPTPLSAEYNSGTITRIGDDRLYVIEIVCGTPLLITGPNFIKAQQVAKSATK